MVIPEAEAGFLLDVSRAHFSGQRQRPLDFVKESTMAACSATSSKFVALVRMLSAWAKAPRKRPLRLGLNLYSSRWSVVDPSLD